MAMTENSKKVFNYLKSAGAGIPFTAKEIQEALDIEKQIAVIGSLNGLCKKDYADKLIETIVDDEGKEKKITKFTLTEKGAAFNPDAED